MTTVNKFIPYIGRWNSTLARKEWHEYGHNFLVVGGSVITYQTPLAVTLTHSPAGSVAVGTVVTLTATVTGGTTPYSYVFSGPVGLSGTGNTRTFTTVTSASNPVFNVTVTDSSTPTAQTQQATHTVPITGAVTGTVLFAGHIPNQVLLGIAASDTNDPVMSSALTIIGQPVREIRKFTAGGYSSGALDSMLADADGASSYGVVEFRHTPWTDVVNGALDSDLASIVAYAKARKTAGKGPFAILYEHEPAGTGITSADLANWAAMNTYMSWYFAGRRGGTPTSTYSATNDITTGAAGTTQCMTFATVGNGFWWRTNAMWTPSTSDANTAYPQTLVDAMRINKGLLLADFYDANYTNQTLAMTSEAARATTSGVSTSARIAQFMLWARKVNTGAVGCGEFGVVAGSEMTASWKVMRDNRDLWAIGNYFDSFSGSDHEWRLIPSTYAATNGTNAKGLVDFGGDANSAARLAAFKTALTESTTTYI